MWERKELKQQAKAKLKLNYWSLVLVSFVFSVVAGGGSSSSSSSSSGSSGSDIFSSAAMEEYLEEILLGAIVLLIIILIVMAIGIAIGLLVFNPLSVGCTKYFIDNEYGTQQLSDMAFAFSSPGYKNIVKTMFFKGLYTFFWSLLFIIPGIVKSYEYRMIPYLIADNPDLSTDEAFRLSKEMMDGNKMAAFVLDLSFIGWNLLSIFTLGLLSIFYVNPYYNLTCAELYHTLNLGYNKPAYASSGETFTESTVVDYNDSFAEFEQNNNNNEL